jgi:hypothetical protein
MAQAEGLRRRMNAFVDSYEGSLNCEELRSSVDSMADLVEDGRTERIWCCFLTRPHSSTDTSTL